MHAMEDSLTVWEGKVQSKFCSFAAQIMRSKISLDSSRELAQNFEDGFVNCLYLVLLIISQSSKQF